MALLGNLGLAQYWSTQAQDNTNFQNLRKQELANQQQEYQMGQLKMQQYQQKLVQDQQTQDAMKSAFSQQADAGTLAGMTQNKQVFQKMLDVGLKTGNKELVNDSEIQLKRLDDAIKEEQATQLQKQKDEREEDARKATPEYAVTDPAGYQATLLKYNPKLTLEMLKDPNIRSAAEKVVDDHAKTDEQRSVAQERIAAAKTAEENRVKDKKNEDIRRAQEKSDLAKLMVGLKRQEDHGSNEMSAEELQSAGSQIAAGQPVNQVIPGYGKNAAGMRERARQEAIMQIIAEDPKLTGIEAGRILAQRNIDYATGKSGKMQEARTIGGLEANITAASTEAKKLVTITKDIANKMDMSNYPSINAVENALSKGVGGTDIVELNTSLNGLVNTYARAINPKGTPTVEDKKEARNIIDNAMSHGQIKAALSIMEKEMDASLASPEAARKTLGIINDLGKKSSSEITKTQSGATVSGW